VGDKRIAPAHRQSKGLLRNLGRLARGGCPGVGRQLGTAGHRSSRLNGERRVEGDLWERNRDEEDSRTQGAPAPHPPVAPSLHATPLTCLRGVIIRSVQAP